MLDLKWLHTLLKMRALLQVQPLQAAKFNSTEVNFNQNMVSMLRIKWLQMDLLTILNQVILLFRIKLELNPINAV